MTSSVISFAYFTHFSNLNISGTDADICKRQTAFLFFHGILCDTHEKSRGKNLIIVPLWVEAQFFLWKWSEKPSNRCSVPGINWKENRDGTNEGHKSFSLKNIIKISSFIPSECTHNLISSLNTTTCNPVLGSHMEDFRSQITVKISLKKRNKLWTILHNL